MYFWKEERISHYIGIVCIYAIRKVIANLKITCTIGRLPAPHLYADIPREILILVSRPKEPGCRSPGKILGEYYRNAPRKI